MSSNNSTIDLDENAILKLKIVELEKKIEQYEKNNQSKGDVFENTVPGIATRCNDSESKSNSPYTHHNLTNAQIIRYGRQLILPDIGVHKQESLCQKSALVVGAGGLGAPICLYLAGAGVGRIGIVDPDEVDLSNLQRQIIHSESTVGTPKAISAKQACAKLNSSISVIAYVTRFDESNAVALVKSYDVIVDATDNVASRYLINDAAVMHKKPVVSGSALRMEGQITTYAYQGGPCYRCLYPVPPPASSVTNCSDGGVLGVVTGIIGCIQALEVIKILIGGNNHESTTLSQRLILVDCTTSTFRTIKLRPRNLNCVVCGDVPTITKLVNYTEFCGTPLQEGEKKIGTISQSLILEAKKSENVSSHSIFIAQLADLYDKQSCKFSNACLIVDVRDSIQFEICSLPGSLNIPYQEFQKNMDFVLQSIIVAMSSNPKSCLNATASASNVSTFDAQIFPIYIICRRGMYSAAASRLLNKYLATSQSPTQLRAFNVIGGIEAWHLHIDQTFPLY
jgi:adenylyltransferase/sulfurtransferase